MGSFEEPQKVWVVGTRSISWQEARVKLGGSLGPSQVSEAP